MNVNALLFITFILATVLATLSSAVPVELYGGDFVDLTGKPLAGHTVILEETQQNWTLNATGQLTLDLPAGRMLLTARAAEGLSGYLIDLRTVRLRKLE